MYNYNTLSLFSFGETGGFFLVDTAKGLRVINTNYCSSVHSLRMFEIFLALSMITLLIPYNIYGVTIPMKRLNKYFSTIILILKIHTYLHN